MHCWSNLIEYKWISFLMNVLLSRFLREIHSRRRTLLFCALKALLWIFWSSSLINSYRNKAYFDTLLQITSRQPFVLRSFRVFLESWWPVSRSTLSIAHFNALVSLRWRLPPKKFSKSLSFLESLANKFYVSLAWLLRQNKMPAAAYPSSSFSFKFTTTVRTWRLFKFSDSHQK